MRAFALLLDSETGAFEDTALLPLQESRDIILVSAHVFTHEGSPPRALVVQPEAESPPEHRPLLAALREWPNQQPKRDGRPGYCSPKPIASSSRPYTPPTRQPPRPSRASGRPNIAAHRSIASITARPHPSRERCPNTAPMRRTWRARSAQGSSAPTRRVPARGRRARPHLHGGGPADAVGADQRDRLAWLDAEVEVGDRGVQIG